MLQGFQHSIMDIFLFIYWNNHLVSFCFPSAIAIMNVIINDVEIRRLNTDRIRMETVNVRFVSSLMLLESWSDSALAVCTQHQGCV